MRLFLLSFIIILAACQPKEGSARSGHLKDTLTIVSADTGKRHDFKIEIAMTPDQLRDGLMHRTNLAEDAGMLFWFAGSEEERSFWMKNTLIPLDIIFITKDGIIHNIYERAQPHDLSPISSQGPVAAVLEINGGLAEKLDLRVNDRVEQRFFTK